MGKSVFIAATGQNVGKTTICLGLLAGLMRRKKTVGFMKPVGQEHVETETGGAVDKDVVLFKSHFQLAHPFEEMSPVLFPRGFTRDYLDGKIDRTSLIKKILSSFSSIAEKNDITIVEGTGHTGVGSIVDLNNAQVAAHLKSPVILIASGGLGSSFDELSLNHSHCEKYGAKIAGIILNRVLDDKREMIIEYMTKSLKRWDVPLLGAIPYAPFLSSPTMRDFELLFQTTLMAGAEFRLRHFHHISLVATSLELYRMTPLPNQLIITPAGREDIILATLTRAWNSMIAHPDSPPEIGFILTGKALPKNSLVEQIKEAKIPMLHVPLSSFTAMKMINHYTTKIRQEDTAKVQEAIKVVEKHIDFELLTKVINPE